MKLTRQTKRVRLMNLKSGSLFTMKDRNGFYLKSEYHTNQGACECFIVGSGEMFWGGCKTPAELNNLLVLPINTEGEF